LVPYSKGREPFSYAIKLIAYKKGFMAKFKCKQSGNIFEFVNAHDIKTMKTHPSYEEVVEKPVEAIKKATGKNFKVQETSDAPLP
jgi:hypothetical protein